MQYFIVGMGVDLAIKLLLGIFPQLLKAELSELIITEWITSGILFIATLTAVCLEQLTVNLGVINAMRTSL